MSELASDTLSETLPPTLPLSPSNIDTDFGGIRFNFYEYTEKAVSFDTAF